MADVTPATRLQFGASRLELLPDNALELLVDKSRVHLGDEPDNPSGLSRRYIRNDPKLHAGCLERKVTTDFSYLRRPDSLIVAGIEQ